MVICNFDLFRHIDNFRNKQYLCFLGKKVNQWSITVPPLYQTVIMYFHSPRLSSLTPRGISVTRSARIQEYIPCLRSWSRADKLCSGDISQENPRNTCPPSRLFTISAWTLTIYCWETHIVGNMTIYCFSLNLCMRKSINFILIINP